MLNLWVITNHMSHKRYCIWVRTFLLKNRKYLRRRSSVVIHFQCIVPFHNRTNRKITDLFLYLRFEPFEFLVTSKLLWLSIKYQDRRKRLLNVSIEKSKFWKQNQNHDLEPFSTFYIIQYAFHFESNTKYTYPVTSDWNGVFGSS